MIEFGGYKISPIFEWCDFWIGCYWDRKGRKLYILPLPSVGIVIEVPWNIFMTTYGESVEREERMFHSVRDARLYVRSRVGGDPTHDSYRIISKDRSTKIIVTGCSIEELLREC